jgi:hypothetical protein
MHNPYVYRLTDKVNGKRYIGSRYAKVCDPSDLGVSYFTSRPEVSRLFKTDPSRFDKQVIVTGSKEYVINVEKTLINLYDAVNSDEFYNRTNNTAIHPEDAIKGLSKIHSQKNDMGKSVHASKIGKSNIESGWAAELGRRGKESGRLPLMASAAGKIGGKISTSLRYKCIVCGLTAWPAALGMHQKRSGHEGRVFVS